MKEDQSVLEDNRKSMYPTQVIELPSKGLLYPEDNPLSTGTIELKYMTAKEEDILTTESYIKQGVVLDKLFQSLIVSKNINYDSLLIGDRNAIMVASRIYGYGEKYNTKVTAPSGKVMEVEIDLNDLKAKEFNEDSITKGMNEFKFTTPMDGNVILFKLLTVGDERQIDERLKKYKKVGSRDTKLTTRFYQMIISVDGNTEPPFIRAFIDNQLRALDSRAFREYINSIQPNVDMSVELIDEETGDSFRADVTFGLDFFWPDI